MKACYNLQATEKYTYSIHVNGIWTTSVSVVLIFLKYLGLGF